MKTYIARRLLALLPVALVVATVAFVLMHLAPGDPAYRGGYGGDQTERDGAYHQGTVWGWLLGPFALAHARAYGDREAARAMLEPLGQHLADYGIGSVAEIFDGEPPFAPRGCIAQAWSVAETLRAWQALSGPAAARRASNPPAKTRRR